MFPDEGPPGLHPGCGIPPASYTGLYDAYRPQRGSAEVKRGGWFGAAAAMLLAAVAGTPAAGAAGAVPQVRDLAALGRAAAARRVPIVLEFAASDCRYCRELERDVLVPMRVSGDYRDKALIRRIEIDTGATVRDFGGRPVAAAALARRYGVEVTPVVVLLGPGGRELVPRLVGIANPDFYPGELDAAISRARNRLRAATGAVAAAGGGG